MIELAHVPEYKELNEYYGNPDADADRKPDLAWWEERTKVFDMPFSLRGCWNGQLYKHLRFHRLVGPVIVDALREVSAELKVQAMRWNELGDALNVRLMKADPLMSTHSWGIAIDLNPSKACWQCDPYNQHPCIIEAFKSRGFIWGGDWPKSHWDGQHFQACK